MRTVNVKLYVSPPLMSSVVMAVRGRSSTPLRVHLLVALKTSVAVVSVSVKAMLSGVSVPVRPVMDIVKRHDCMRGTFGLRLIVTVLSSHGWYED